MVFWSPIQIYIGPAANYTRACKIVRRMRSEVMDTDEEQA
jgi:hypothetical protein